MKHATICFLRDKASNKILLGMKKRGYGAGKFNGYGGKVDDGETIKEAAVRELIEESSVKVLPESLKKVGELTFDHPDGSWNRTVHVFIADEWEGKPVETEEMSPHWIHISEIPFDKMWADDWHWLPPVLKGNHVKAEFSFEEDNETLSKLILEQKNSLYE